MVSVFECLGLESAFCGPIDFRAWAFGFRKLRCGFRGPGFLGAGLRLSLLV